MADERRVSSDQRGTSRLETVLFTIGLATSVFTTVLMLWPIIPWLTSSRTGERVEVEVFPKFVTGAGDGIESSVRFADTNITSFHFFGAASTSIAAVERFCGKGNYFPVKPATAKDDRTGESDITRDYLGMTIGNDNVCIQDQATGSGDGLNVEVVQMNSGGFRAAGGERVPLNKIAISEANDWKTPLKDKILPGLFGVGLTLFLDRIRVVYRHHRRG